MKNGKDLWNSFIATAAAYKIKIIPKSFFSWDDDSVNCEFHFYIEGIKGWLWGGWIENEEATGKVSFTLFTQYEMLIDKFKPSYSHTTIEHIVAERKGGTNIFEILDEDKISEFITKVNYVRDHPAMAYCYWDIYDFRGEWRAKRMMFEEILYHKILETNAAIAHKVKVAAATLFGSWLKWMTVAYIPDKNSHIEEKGSMHEFINDIWVIHSYNKVSAAIAKLFFQKINSYFGAAAYITESEDDFFWDVYSYGPCRQEKYQLKSYKENEDGTIKVDEDEVWAIVNQMDYNDDVHIYGGDQI